MEQKQSDKELEARNSLPEELKPIFDKFVSDYKYAATMRHGRPYISYIVLADMIRAGWRLSAELIDEKKEKLSISDKSRQFLRVFNHVYLQWFTVPGYNPPVDNEPLTEEEMELAADISDYCEQLFYRITDEQDEKNKGKKPLKPSPPATAGK
jgi:hypothetical protein